jgi:hypothetical protein
MKIISQSIFTISAVLLGMNVFVAKAYAAQSCPEAVALEGSSAADDDTGADPDLMTEECRSDYTSIQLLSTNKYSVLVDCGDGSKLKYVVTVAQVGDMCRATDSQQDKSYKPATN